MRRIFPYLGTVVLLATAAFSAKYALQTQQALSEDVLLSSVEPTDVGSAQTSSSVPTAVSMPRLRPDVYYEAITDRPIFAPTRRPFVPGQEKVEETVQSEEEQPQVARPLPEFDLLGIMGSTDQPIALLKADSEPAEWYEIGESIDGWVLSEIDADWVEITDGNSNVRLEMFQ